MRNEEGRNVREKVMYFFQPVLATAKSYKAFTMSDGQYGENGYLTNAESADGTLPDGHEMLIQKVGFFVRPKLGVTALALADLSKLAHGTYSIKKGEDELKKGTLSEFFPSFAVSGSVPIDSNQEFSTVLLPLLQEEHWDTEKLSFEYWLPAGITADIMEVAAVVKGIYES